MVKITIFVEGGGDNRLQQRGCRKGFSEFFKKLGIKPKIVACGSRKNAYDSFCTGLKNTKDNEYSLLLVDSEAPVKANMSVWQHVHLHEGGKWSKPDKATDGHLNFMVECMEAWFMADKQTLADYYGQGFNQNALSQNAKIEDISKQDLYATLNRATRNTTKGSYSKGSHSFEILSQIDANAVIVNSPHAKKLRDTLQELLKPPTPSS